MAIDDKGFEICEIDSGNDSHYSVTLRDNDPASFSEDEKEEDWSHGKSLTTLMFQNRQLD
jgi:hypothetical protein